MRKSVIFGGNNMAGLNSITICTSEYRPCIVDEKKALFHRWEDFKNVIGESMMRGGHGAGQIAYTLGIVEFEDGKIKRVGPENIKFCDNKIADYSFGMSEKAKE